MPPRREALLALALCAVAEVETLSSGDSLAFAAAIPFFTLPLAWRVRRALLVAVGGVMAIAAAHFVEAPEWSSIAAMVAFILLPYSVGAHEPRPRALAGIAAIVTVFAAQELAMRPNDDDFLFILIVAVGAWLAGRGVRARRRQAERLSELTARLGREREVNAALAVSEERLRVARELHDSVAGLLNVMVIQAAAAEAAPGQAADAVAAVQRAGREAASELARMLELLGGADGREPQPGLDRLDDLVAFARSAGVPVQLEVRGRRRLPAGLELSAYRIVQEALTNVVKHASGAATTVRLDFSTDALQIEVVDSGAGGAAMGVNGGHGLVNMRERVALFGGEVDSSPLHGGGFRVRARLPVA